MPHTARRRSLLSAVRNTSSRRRLARGSTRRVLRYHALTERSMSSTTGQPRNRRYIRVSQQRKTKLRWPENSTRYRAPKRTQAAQQQQQCEYIHTCVYKRGRFPQTRDLWRKSASMGYRVSRVSLHAVSRWSRSPGCCGYISWCVFLVSGGISFFFFRFLYFERTRPTASTRQPCLMYLSTSTRVRTGCHYLIILSMCVCV